LLRQLARAFLCAIRRSEFIHREEYGEWRDGCEQSNNLHSKAQQPGVFCSRKIQITFLFPFLFLHCPHDVTVRNQQVEIRNCPERNPAMPSISLTVNGKKQTVDVTPDTPLLWVLRDTLGFTGTKFGCGIAQCGACTVHINGEATRSCVTPIDSCAGKSIVTIEGLSADVSHPLQKAWIEEDVPQCGYCQSGQIMSAAALLAQKPQPTDKDIDDAMGTVLCRCGTYPRIRRAIHRAAGQKGGKS
jgi:aerobic-type carbon monoxide dehydrogenase small subunit (CoxS/CutS family)